MLVSTCLSIQVLAVFPPRPLASSLPHSSHAITLSTACARLGPQRQGHRLDSPIEYRALQASSSSYIRILVALGGSALLLDYLTRKNPSSAPSKSRDLAQSPLTTSNDLFFTDMPIPSGHRGNLTADQETKLRELWALALKTFGVHDLSHPNGVPHHEDSLPVSEAETKDDKRKKRKSIFSRKHGDSGSSPSKAAVDSDDKYGQVKEYQQIVSTQSPESLRATFWSMVKADHPDALLLRFLRARKWDVDKALVMMISTMSWRGHEMHVDDDVVFHGEGGALRDSKSSDAHAKSEGADFLAADEVRKELSAWY